MPNVGSDEFFHVNDEYFYFLTEFYFESRDTKLSFINTLR